MNDFYIAVKAAKKAGEYLNNLKKINIIESNGKDIKLEADKKAESIIIEILSQTSYTILSEESPTFNWKKEQYCWIIDPIDGTFNFSRNLNYLSCISIALYQYGNPIYGLIYQYHEDKLYTINQDNKPIINNVVYSPSNVTEIEQSVLATGLSIYRDYTQESMNNFSKNLSYFKKIRMLGTGSLMSSLVSFGFFDIYQENKMKIWDVAAGIAIAHLIGIPYQTYFYDDITLDVLIIANQNLFEKYQNVCGEK